MKFRNIAMCFFAVAGLALDSCIREDHSDCYNRYCLELSYVGDGTEEIFSEKIDRVDMYVFDSLGRCVENSSLPEKDLKARSTMLPPLPPGDYRIILIGNPHSTGTEGLSSGDFSQMTFASQDYLEGRVPSGNDPLYHASVNYRIEPYDWQKQMEVRTALFSSSHYDVTVEVSGVPSVDTRSSGLPVIELSGLSPGTDFNNVACGDPVSYILTSTHDGSRTLSAECSIMRHADQSEVYLRVLSSDRKEVLAEVNFADFIEEHPDVIDVSLHEVLIPFRIEFLSADVSISLPDWMINEVKPEF